MTQVSAFILVGFPTAPWLQYPLFLLFLLTYLFVLVENLAIILTVWGSPSLHRPMYYFLGSMSFLEIWYVSDIIPKMLDGFLLLLAWDMPRMEGAGRLQTMGSQKVGHD